jgi:hypothetical protein
MNRNDAVKYLTPKIQLLDLVSEPKNKNNKKKVNNAVLRIIIHHMRLLKAVMEFIMNEIVSMMKRNAILLL